MKGPLWKKPSYTSAIHISPVPLAKGKRMAASTVHVRSSSLPTTTHPLVLSVEEQLTKHMLVAPGAPSQKLSGTLAPSIGNLTNLQLVLLQNNDISGHISSEIRKLPKLHTLDLSNNFSGQIPSTLSNLETLQYLRLNNNSLSGIIPSSLANTTQLSFLDLSFNNLSGPLPGLLAKTFN
ncbi:hypothetical protein HRI_002563600 [Hibiscus trionum]|uniref:Uncharacterized protein n=1 Tax=Hibiscus trionum TaxID=183268 RepID=A0A9W7I6J8_HIBTR|nr:hypothetical protein HRI_002563600 [Hibiscus trionum]